MDCDLILLVVQRPVLRASNKIKGKILPDLLNLFNFFVNIDVFLESFQTSFHPNNFVKKCCIHKT